ncbi:MAG TPA: transglutaminaseTgpA domain-containing protein [Nitriliruptorales bacterium]
MSVQAPSPPTGQRVPDPEVVANGIPEALDERPEAPRRAAVTQTTVAASVAAIGAGWMLAGLFDGGLARVLAVIAPLAGGSLTWVSHRAGRPALGQYLVVPVAVVLAGLVVLPDTPGGSANVATLVSEALFSGGLGQPPVPFDPGWRFLLVAVLVVLPAGSAGLALGLDRPRLAVALPLPLILLAGLVQPASAELVSTVGATVATVVALVVDHGNELVRTGAADGRFELRRFAHGLGAVVALAVALVVLANVAGFLLPPVQEDEIVPPQRPPVAPPQEDRALFSVEAPDARPLRLGVLDVYQDGAWMLPPGDPGRLVEAGGGPLPTGEPDGARGASFEVAIQIVDLGGRSLPTPPGARAVDAAGAQLEYDPRTRTLRAAERADPGLRYVVEVGPPPDTDALLAHLGTTGLDEDHTAAPPPPAAVRALLAEAPAEPLFERLQFVRQAYYDQVVAAGAGDPVDTPPARVVEILGGDPATPYEIAAGEALLARWAGVPARLGFGYAGGEPEPQRDGLTVRPGDGAIWLEVHVERYGWVPIVGTPPRARSSLDEGPRNDDPAVRPTDELALITFVPVQRTGPQLLFEVTRYWALRIVPVVALAVAVLAFAPVLLRVLRRARRRRWAGGRGPAQRVAVAYAELRDWACDANLARPSVTPLELVRRVQDDDEHRELAWLVTRVLWGDLTRDVRDVDAQLAEELSRSVHKRLRGAQPGLARILAGSSRASLRDPYSDELPNLWPSRSLGDVVRGWPGAARRRIRRLVGRPAAATGALLLVVALALAGCTDRLDLDARLPALPFAEPLTPPELGEVRFVREPEAEQPFDEAGPEALVGAGRVFSVHVQDDIEASLQVAAFKPGVLERRDDLVDEVLRSLGGRAEPTRFGERRGYALERGEQRILLWFAPDLTYYELLVARSSYEDADEVFGAVLAFQHGEPVAGLDAPRTQQRHDPRRGTPG